MTLARTRVKVCGVCSPQDAELALEAGADLLGMHFCSSLRQIPVEAGQEIARAVRGRATVVGVFIDAGADEIARVADAVGLDLVQLHGQEPPAEYARPVIKALKVRDGRLPDVSAWPDPILLDSWSADGRGGTGRTWSWESARGLAARRDVMIAGGLTPENVGALVAAIRPYGVDVSSGVESEVRRKDPELMRRFVQAVRDAEQG